MAIRAPDGANKWHQFIHPGLYLRMSLCRSVTVWLHWLKLISSSALIALTSSSLSHLPIHVSTNSFPGSLQSSRFHLLALFYFSLLAFFPSFLNISNLGCSMHCKRSKQNAGTLESRLQSGPECAPSFAALWLQLRNVNCEIALPVKVLSIVK